MVADVVAVLHLALQHNGAGLEAAVRVVREAGSGLASRQLQLVLWTIQRWLSQVPVTCYRLSNRSTLADTRTRSIDLEATA
jgi:hypothetical protein